MLNLPYVEFLVWYKNARPPAKSRSSGYLPAQLIQFLAAAVATEFYPVYSQTEQLTFEKKKKGQEVGLVNEFIIYYGLH